MLDLSNLDSGIDKLFGNIDYSGLDDANMHYKKLLNLTPMPIPKFLSTVSQEELTRKRSIGEPFTDAEQAYLNLREHEGKLAEFSRSEHLTFFREISSLFPRDSLLQLRLARLLIRVENYADATYFLWRCVQVDETCADAWARLALIAALAHDHGQAAFCARKAIENGNDLYRSMQKAFTFSLLALGAPALVSPYNNDLLFNDEPLSVDDLPHRPPEIEFIREPQKPLNTPVVMFACEDRYFERFGKNMIRSLATAKDDLCIHVHLMRPSDTTIDWLIDFSEQYGLKIIITKEDTPEGLFAQKPYLASSRFIVLADFLRRYQTPYLVVDADTILNSPEALKAFFEHNKQPTVFHTDGPVWDTITAAFVYLPYGDVSLDIAGICQRYLLRMFFSDPRRSFWYMDQMALLAACLNNAQNVMLAPGKMVSCINCGDDAIFWFLSNDKTIQKYWDLCSELENKFPMATDNLQSQGPDDG